MNKLKRICAAMLQRVKQAWLFPQTVAVAIKKQQRPAARSEAEIERLDRLRNPSKYLGK